MLLATHSTEIVSEAEPASLLVVNKRYRNAQHVKNTGQLQHLFGELGSNLNPTLTQLAKTKRAVFVEGQDFITLSLFARKLGKTAVANRSDFAVIPLEGFTPKKVIDMKAGFAEALGADVAVAVVLDRDYRTAEEVSKVKLELRDHALVAHVHTRKEIENYLLAMNALQTATHLRIKDRASRGGEPPREEPNVASICEEVMNKMKSDIAGQFIARRVHERKLSHPELDFSTLNSQAFDEFEGIWSDTTRRIELVPGKRVLAALNTKLQELADVSVTPVSIIDAMKPAEIPLEIIGLVDVLNDFRSAY